MLTSPRSCLLLYKTWDRCSTQPAAERLVWSGEWPNFSLCKWVATLSHATYHTNYLLLEQASIYVLFRRISYKKIAPVRSKLRGYQLARLSFGSIALKRYFPAYASAFQPALSIHGISLSIYSQNPIWQFTREISSPVICTLVLYWLLHRIQQNWLFVGFAESWTELSSTVIDQSNAAT